MSGLRGRVPLAVLLAVGVVLLPAARLLVLGGRDLERGRLASRGGDDMAAQAFLERAARTYFPGNVFAAAALDELSALSSGREGSGDLPGALAAAESRRSAMIATGGDLARPARRRQADERVARLRADLGRSWPAGKAPSGDEEGRGQASLQRPRDPRAFPAAAGILLFLAAGLSAARAAACLSLPGDARQGLAWYGAALVASSLALAFLLAA